MTSFPQYGIELCSPGSTLSECAAISTILMLSIVDRYRSVRVWIPNNGGVTICCVLAHI